MSLESSLTDLLSRLSDWRGYPKYSLERRVDIFLTPFLESFLGWKLNGDATLVAPEYPLLASLEDPDPPAPGSSRWTAHTVNVDYLVHLRRREGRNHAWVFVELKTDGHSFRDKQDVTYWNAMARGMTELRADLGLVADRTEARHRPKYRKLLDRLQPFLTEHAKDPIELAYLGPRVERRAKPDFVESADSKDPRRDRVHFLSLSTMANQPEALVPEEHRVLWRHVRELLLELDPD